MKNFSRIFLAVFFLCNAICFIIPRRFLLFLARVLAFFLQYVPLHPLDRNIRVINYYLKTKKRKTFSFREIKRRNIFYSLKSCVDFFKYMVQSPQKREEILKPAEGEAELLSLYGEGKGVVGVCLHYGNWELGGNYLSSLGLSFHSLFFRQLDADLDRVLNRIRRNCDIGLLHQRGGLKKAVEYLRRGEMITFLGDQDGTRNGFFQSFMGLHCSFPRAIELFVRKTDAVLLPMVLKHDDNTDGYAAFFYPPLGYAVDFRDRLPELHAKIRDFYEEQILADPAQWLLFYNRFRFRHDDFLREQGIFEQISREYKRAWQG